MSFRALAYATRVVLPRHRKELKGLPLAVYIALCDTANNESLVAFPSVFRLAQQCDCNREQVSKATHHLQSLGLIYINHFKDTTNRYKINVPEWFNERTYQFHASTEARTDCFDSDGIPEPPDFDFPIGEY